VTARTNRGGVSSSVLDGVKVLAVISGLLAALAVAGAAPATTPVPGETQALKTLRVAPIDTNTRADGRAEVTRAVHLIRTLPSGRREHIAVALGELASFYKKLTEPRALALIGELRANNDYFAEHYAPAAKTDIVDADGLVYRYFPGRCLEFHPLANFGALNAHIAANDAEGTQKLADALIARGVYQRGGGVAWEYDFDYAGGHAPWTSGMAQAVAAQAFARAASLVPDQTTPYLREAQAAYHAIPGQLMTSVAAGPWIRLYSFETTRVLNAQLQAIVSLQSYATTAEDTAAAALANRMQAATLATLPQFDTGYWTYYALPHDPSPIDYQQFVVQLLRKLGPNDPRFADAATRINGYLKQPPAFRVANGSLGALRFWLSKPSSVQVNTAAGPTKRASLSEGWHTLSWTEPKRAGIYPVHVSATDYAGNHSSFDALPFVRATAAKPPRTTSAVGSSGLSVGAALPDVSQAATLQKLGIRLVRVGVTWPAGATAVDPNVVTALQSIPPSMGIVLELTADPLPVDDAGRASLAQYALSIAQQVPNLRDLILEPALTTTTAASLVPAFVQVQGAVTTIPVGIAVDGSLAPKASLAALAGQIAPGVVAFRPAPAAGKNLWTLANVTALKTAVANADGTSPDLILDGASPSELPSLACGGQFSTVLFDDVTGVTASAIQTAQRGSVVCPGITRTVAPTGLTWPTTIASPASVRFGCDTDCLYLVTLDGPDGRPVVAKRGAMNGGAAPATVTLPSAKLGTGPYKISIRLLAQVNPGELATYTNP
jgi:D-glucuronyl C5-epimerase C-terminus